MNSKSHHNPDHPRFCSRERFHTLRAPRRNRPARTTGRHSISFAPPPLNRTELAQKHHASTTRRNAFLDLNAATERNARYNRNAKLAKALGRELNPACKPEDMDFWTNRHRAAVTVQRIVFARYANRA